MTEFKRLSEASTLGEPLCLLLYGGSGTGKTWFMGTAGSRQLIIDCGYGLKTIESPAFIKDVGKIDPIIVKIEEKLGARGILESAVAYDAVCDSIDDALKQIPNDFDTIVIDEMTSLRRFAMHKALEVNQASGKSKTLKAGRESGALMPAVQDWGAEMSLIMQLIDGYIRICKEHGKNFIVGAHERMTYTKPRGPTGSIVIGEPPILVRIRPGFTGQTFPDDIPALFDECWRMECVGGDRGTTYRAILQGDEIITAKTRHGGIWDRVVRNPNFLVMLAKMQGIKPSTV